MQIRPIDWQTDEAAIRSFDTSLTIERHYSLHQHGLAFALEENPCAHPILKNYPIDLTETDVRAAIVSLAACDGGVRQGFAVVQREAWNRRAIITDFFISPRYRGRGIGRQLMQQVIARLDPTHARILWLETQNTNHPAIQFYLKMGFRVCGFDSTLYDDPRAHEVAIFMSRELA